MATNSDLKAFKDLLLWARREKIVLSEVKIGTLSVQVDRDHGIKLPSSPMPMERKVSILEQYGGALLQDQPAMTQNETTVEDEE